jgi:hypothetical protein
MISDKAKTFKELKTKRAVYNLAKYYYLTDEQLNHIYEFLVSTPNSFMLATKTAIKLYKSQNSLVESIGVSSKVSQYNGISFDGYRIDETGDHVVSHYISTSTRSGGYSSSSGSSTNNNNNNNNN